MNPVGQREIHTQRRVAAFFRDALGYSCLGDWQPEFIRPFFATVQLLMAGNDTEGLRYGVVETPEKHWLRWKEADAHPAAGDNPMLRELGQLCAKPRLLEIVHDFMVFDAGVRKTCRHNQYFGVRAAQTRVRSREGGIVWHTQGSGKSLTMVWLAKWIRELFVFVDECHRTQSRKLHKAMKKLLPDAMLSGFTGTPLLKDDKQWSIETFGSYIHTYKYDETVNDGVVLDLRYEARDIDQQLTSEDRIDRWFEVKTRGLTDVAKARLKQRWGTMRKVLSSRDRLEKIVADVLLDMETRDRLRGGRGNALLVSDSIYSACRIHEMFDKTELKGKCAIVTSYRPVVSDIKGEETGEGHTGKLLQYDVYRRMLAAHFDEPEETAMHKVERFEQEVKQRFVDEPGRMKLLIVVDKLLTGFDAPPATCLYIDKQMRDHGLFQAICRVNRLDGEDKEYGCVIDYKDLFRSLEQSIEDYTGEAFDGYDSEDVKGLLKDRLQSGRERLEEAREAVKTLCEPVEPPHDSAAYLRFFCAAESGDAVQLKENEPRRVVLYKLTVALLRAYANLANEMQEAGYSEVEAQEVRVEVDHYEKVRQEVKLAVTEHPGPPTVRLLDNTRMILRVRPGAGRNTREAILHRWYRRRLRGRLPALIAKWEPRVDVQVAEARIKKMKTRWGTCNRDARRIWLNLELAKKPASCLEYVVVHEMVHLIELRHNDRFRDLMDRFLPRWRLHRDHLNRAPLAHEDWRY